MDQTAPRRRLATILAADIAGYSRLMAADEEGVIARLRAARAAIVDPAVAAGGGRIVKTMGDGLLIEFPSPVEAVRAALAVQTAVNAAEAAHGPDSRMLLRIGVHFGDVMVDGDDLLGDVVNVAARLETLSPVGGLCVSRTVREMIRGKVTAELTDLGPQMVKNMPEPVEVWRVEVEGASAPAPAARGTAPSIAVLPFASRSPDPDDAYLADGIVEDVTNELSRFRALTVIASASSATFRETAEDARAIGRALGARYLVQGSVRRAGERLRVTAQLIEAETGVQIWSDRWDRTTADLFDLQDDLTRAIVTAVEPELGAHERTLARRKPTESLTAWELCQRAYATLGHYSDDSFAAAHALLVRSVEADPEFALPRALLSRIFNVRVASGRTRDPAADVAEAIRWAREALAIDDRLEVAHMARGVAQAMAREEEGARESLRTAVALNPNHAGCRHGRALIEMFMLTPDGEAMVENAEMALALSPKDPTAHAMRHLVTLGWLFASRDHANPDFRRNALAAARYPGADYYVHLFAACAEAAIGNVAETRRHVAEALRRKPGLTFRSYREGFPFPAVQELFDLSDRNGVNEALVAAGLPRG